MAKTKERRLIDQQQFDELTKEELQTYLGIVAVSCGWWSARLVGTAQDPKHKGLLILEFMRDG